MILAIDLGQKLGYSVSNITLLKQLILGWALYFSMTPEKVIKV